jgi:hypothetical protein
MSPLPAGSPPPFSLIFFTRKAPATDMGKPQDFDTLMHQFFMRHPLEERRKIMERQAEELRQHYEDTLGERDEIQGGDFVEYEQ